MSWLKFQILETLYKSDQNSLVKFISSLYKMWKSARGEYLNKALYKEVKTPGSCFFFRRPYFFSFVLMCHDEAHSFFGSNIICLFFCIFLSVWCPSLLFVGWHVVTLVICSPLLTGLEVLVPTVWSQIQIPIHPKGTRKTPFFVPKFFCFDRSFLFFTDVCAIHRHV